MKRLKNARGITLIALVVTIVVLLILAAVSISMLGGENGIITQSKESKEITEQEKVEEIVELAKESLIIENVGSTSGITPKDIADKINAEYSQYNNVYAEDEENFPTKIVFPEENREVDVDLEVSLKDIYNADVSKSDIAPTEIFEYEIINDAETGAIRYSSLPTKEVRITGIKPEYCNDMINGYESETGQIYEKTNYEIILKDGSKITDTLVIPYQVEINGEMYKITEANIRAFGSDGVGHDGSNIPNVKTLIYPNTITKIIGTKGDYNRILEKVILPSNLREIGEQTFYECTNLNNIEIPSSVISIGKEAFYRCDSLTTVNYTGTKAQWQQINIENTNNNNSDLTNAQIICTDGTINQ